jgi:dienelactone hydrolase
VLVHGIDGLGGDSGKQIKAFAEELRDNGYLALVPHYFGKDDGKDDGAFDLIAFEKRFANYGKYSERLAAAITEALNDPRAEKDKLGLIGFSLGGGLVLAHAESASGTVDAVVDFFGYIPPMSGIYANVSSLPPTIVFHNNADGVVDVRHSKDLVAALDKGMKPHDHKFYDDKNPDKKNHPFLPGGDADKDSRMKTLGWLKTHVK